MDALKAEVSQRIKKAVMKYVEQSLDVEVIHEENLWIQLRVRDSSNGMPRYFQVTVAERIY